MAKKSTRIYLSNGLGDASTGKIPWWLIVAAAAGVYLLWRKK